MVHHGTDSGRKRTYAMVVCLLDRNNLRKQVTATTQTFLLTLNVDGDSGQRDDDLEGPAAFDVLHIGPTTTMSRTANSAAGNFLLVTSTIRTALASCGNVQRESRIRYWRGR